MAGTGMRRLDGKTILITGGARGQGEAEARMFCEEGASVIIADVLDEEGAAVEASLCSQGHRCLYRHLDVSDPAEWASLAAAISGWSGALHGLVNNAGILNRTGIMGTSVDRWNRVVSVNLTGAFLGMQAMAPLMRDSGGGSVVNIASVAAYAGHNDPAYAGTKAGLLGLTRTAAMEHPRQRHQPGHHCHRAQCRWCASGTVEAGHTARPLRADRGGRKTGALPAQRRRLLHYGRGHCGRWRVQGGRRCAAGFHRSWNRPDG